MTHPATEIQTTSPSGLCERVTILTVTPEVELDTDAFFLTKGWYLGPNFQQHFLGRKYKTDGNPVTIAIDTLKRRAEEALIIKDLGGLPKIKISLPVFAAVMALQTNCEPGDLLTNGGSNVGYIDDDTTTPWTIRCFPIDDSWYVEVNYVGYPEDWHPGSQFLSGNP